MRGARQGPAFIDLSVDGIDGLRAFIDRVNLIDRNVRAQASFAIALNWHRESVTACAFDRFPSSIMLSWQIRGTGPDGAPSAALLSLIAKRWKSAHLGAPKRV